MDNPGSRILTPEEQERLESYKKSIQRTQEEVEAEQARKRRREFLEEAGRYGFTPEQLSFLEKHFSRKDHEHSRWLR